MTLRISEVKVPQGTWLLLPETGLEDSGRSLAMGIGGPPFGDRAAIGEMGWSRVLRW